MVEEFLRTEAKKILHKYRCTRTSDCQLCFSQLKCVCVNNLKNVLEAAMNTLFIPILNTEKIPFFLTFPIQFTFFPFLLFSLFLWLRPHIHGYFLKPEIFCFLFFFKNPVHMWYSLSTLPDVFVDVRCLLDCGTDTHQLLVLSFTLSIQLQGAGDVVKASMQGQELPVLDVSGFYLLRWPAYIKIYMCASGVKKPNTCSKM